MHTKHLSYEEAVKKLKELEIDQATDKAIRNKQFSIKNGFGPAYQKKVLENKREINLLLSIIKLYKESHRMYAAINGWGPSKDFIDKSKIN